MSSSHLLGHGDAQAIRLRSMDGFDLGMEFPREPEQASEGVCASRLIPEFAFSKTVIGQDRILQWTARDHAIAAAALGAEVANLLHTVRVGDAMDLETEWIAMRLAREAWFYASEALRIEEVELQSIGGAVR